MNELLIEQMVRQQEKKLLSVARVLVPDLTFEDILQPQDYPELEASVEFRYEEGVLVGLCNALAALRAEKNKTFDASYF